MSSGARIISLRDAMIDEIEGLRAGIDRDFGRLLERIARDVYREWIALAKRIQTDDVGRLLLNSQNLLTARQINAQTEAVLREALKVLETTDNPTFRDFAEAAQAAADRVVESTIIRDGIAPAAPFERLEFQAVQTAWQNTGQILAGYTENMQTVVRNELTQNMLRGRTRRRLENVFADLNRSSDTLRGPNRSDAFHPARARLQVRGEMTRVYQQTSTETAELAGFQLYEHMGPRDDRNVEHIGQASPPGVVGQRFARLGSSDFIGHILSKPQWLAISRTALTYGLHYGERGLFQPVDEDWPGVRNQWEKSQKRFKFIESQQEPVASN